MDAFANCGSEGNESEEGNVSRLANALALLYSGDFKGVERGSLRLISNPFVGVLASGCGGGVVDLAGVATPRFCG